MELEKLIESAKEASKFSYSPYSNYKLGAALLTKSGKIYKGTNIENASYPLTCCAERVAIFKAVSEGEKDFEAICIYSNDESFPYPCGACRQVMAQFSKDLKIYVVNANKDVKEYTIKELLPHTFEF